MSSRQSLQVKLVNKLGLHARAAAQFAKCAEEFSSQIMVEYKNESVDGKSILDLLTLGIYQGECFDIHATGDDALQALQKLNELVENLFGEKE